MWTGRTTGVAVQGKERSTAMTANQRRPGFRLPWSSEGGAEESAPADGPEQADATYTVAAAPVADAAVTAASDDDAPAAPEADADDAMSQQVAEAGDTQEPAASPEPPADEPAPAAATEGAGPATGFMGDLVAAMRRVADEARESTLADLRGRVDDAIREREEDAERSRRELRGQAETDIAAVGEWAKAEAERIKADAEQRVASRRAQLDRQLAAETSHVESRSDALRSRITSYERELEAFHAQLAAVNDPAAFAAAATRMPPPPALDGSLAAEPQAPEPAPEPEAAKEADTAPALGTNGSAPVAPVADDEGTQLPATELERLDASADAEPETYAEPIATEIVVKGLGSFGSITGFRQQLANVEGIDAVGLSLGTSGEFVFRATHRPSLDMAAAITALEGEAVDIEPRAEGGIRVTLGRPR